MTFDRFDFLYLSGIACVGTGAWWLSPAWSLVAIGGLLMAPVVLGWFKTEEKTTK